MDRLVVFGTGSFYKRRKALLPSSAMIVAYLDNNKDLEGKDIDGIKVYLPTEVKELKYDYIILVSGVPGQMKEQLLKLGVQMAKIVYWEEYISIKSKGIVEKYRPINTVQAKQSFLVIVPMVNYAGGFLTALYFAQAMLERGYRVVIATQIADNKLVQEILDLGIEVWICPSLLYLDEVELKWINSFDYILCNSLYTIVCASKIKKGKKLLFWLHEYSAQYKDLVEQYKDYIEIENLSYINIAAVSGIAKNNFANYFSNLESKVQILPFGIPEINAVNEKAKVNIELMLCGAIYPLKNQIAFVEALDELTDKSKLKIHCKIIGKEVNKTYSDRLKHIVEKLAYVDVCGEYNRKQLEKELVNIDIVVCTSDEETMSMSIVEGMRSSAICLTNDNTGIAEFISNGKNGFVYKQGDKNDLKNKLEHIVEHFSELDYMRHNARKTYEKYFSMEAFGGEIGKIYMLD